MRALSRERVCLYGCNEFGVGNFGVNLDRGQVRMAQSSLELTKIVGGHAGRGIGAKSKSRKGVPQHVDTAAGASSASLPKDSVDYVCDARLGSFDARARLTLSVGPDPSSAAGHKKSSGL